MIEKWVEKLVELAHKYPRCRYCFVGVMAVVYGIDCVADFWCEKIGGKQFKKAFISTICIMLMVALGTQRIEANQQNIIITAYEELSEAISVQEVVVGTSEEELNLPSTLKGTGYVEEVDVPQVEPVIEEEVSVPVTWVSEPLFNGDTVGTYVFKAMIDENYKGVEPLSITVHVIEAEEPVPNGIEEWINKVNGLTDSAVELAQMPQKDSEEFAEWEASMQVKVDLANELLSEYELFEESVKLEINEELINKLKDWQVVLDTHEEIPLV